jgi:hypothetical protein
MSLPEASRKGSLSIDTQNATGVGPSVGRITRGMSRAWNRNEIQPLANCPSAPIFDPRGNPVWWRRDGAPRTG